MPDQITPRAAEPLSIRVVDDVLTIRIGVGALAFAAQSSGAWPGEWRVSDLAAFAADVVVTLKCGDGETGLSPVHKLLDEATIAALESGSDGVDEGAVEEGLVLAQSGVTPPLPAHVVLINGVRSRADSKGRWMSEALFKPQDLIQDDMVRGMIAAAKAQAETLTAFREQALMEAESFRDLLDQHYGVTKGGPKGNVNFTTLDGTAKMEVRVNDTISFGPELQQAKGIIDECLSEWSTDARPEIRAIVMRAFDVEKSGQINKGELFMLMRLEIEDARWQRAMQAIRDSIRRDGTKTFVRFSERDAPDGKWRTISLDIAQA